MSSAHSFLITQSLLSDFLWVFKKETGYEEFLDALKRKRKPPTTAMLDGIQFENMVTACAQGEAIDDGHKWARGIREVAGACRGGQFQVRLSREITVDGVAFLCYGILDNLRAGEIFDVKFSKTYSVGKYRESPQHPMYFYLCPEARSFTYLVSDGAWVYRETYAPEITEPIETTIRHFMAWLDKRNLVDEYARNWRAA